MNRIMSEIDVKAGLRNILQRIDSACQKRIPELKCLTPQLVAVSKTKPVEMIIECYEEGQRHFGENYVQELVDKANNKDILEKCKEIQWHYIGNIQSNKLNKILSVPNLYLMETVDREKIADALNKTWPKFACHPEQRLNVFLQVNTSGEEAKGGIEPDNVISLAKYVIEQCPNLKFDGLMTIGRFDYNVEDGPNPDFLCLKRCRDEICQQLEIDWKDVNLSMGMSDDFEHAIELGSTNVRVGSSIFGHRPRKV